METEPSPESRPLSESLESLSLSLESLEPMSLEPMSVEPMSVEPMSVPLDWSQESEWSPPPGRNRGPAAPARRRTHL